MSITDVQMLFQFVGGLGMFLYGMNAMADGLQKSAGHRMQQLLGALTKNRLMGVILGAGITAIIQSSSATTVMVVGFVNAGIMNLGQAVGIIMGANIGTTVTSWIVSMSEWGEMLKPEFFAPALVGVGAIMTLFCKNSRKKQVGEILVGFGVLFIGLTFMSAAITPYRSDFCAGVYRTWKKSVSWHSGGSCSNGNYPELFRLRRDFADTGVKWNRELAVCHLYYAGTEYRDVRDGASVQRGSQ